MYLKGETPERHNLHIPAHTKTGHVKLLQEGFYLQIKKRDSELGRGLLGKGLAMEALGSSSDL